MSSLTVYSESGSKFPSVFIEHQAIADQLSLVGVLFERWQADQVLSKEAGQEEVVAAYRGAIDALNKKFDFKTLDVVSLTPDNPKKLEFRQKFLAEHRHADFEIRFFVDGCGLFYLHLDAKIYLVLCEKGDLISVPANTPHWFDMGRNPYFKALRFFTTPDGWVGDFTGSDIAQRFPSFEEHVAFLTQAGQGKE